MSTNSTQQLLKSLEDRAKEIENLKKVLQQCEKERNILETQKRTFDARQPIDVQTLLTQKRDLQIQLTREESEKHELFTQINKLISEIADLRAEDTSHELIAQLNNIATENEELKRDFGRKEAEFQTLRRELDGIRAELERRERAHQLEKARLAAEIQDTQRDLELKNTIFESSNKIYNTSEQPIDHLLKERDALREEILQLRNEVQEKDDLLRELTESNDELGRALSASSSDLDKSRAQIDETANNLESIRIELKRFESEVKTEKMEKNEIITKLEAIKVQLAEKVEECADKEQKIQTLQSKVNSQEIDIQKLRTLSKQNSVAELKATNEELDTPNQHVNDLEDAVESQSPLELLQMERDNLLKELTETLIRLENVNASVSELECSLELVQNQFIKEQDEKCAIKNQLETMTHDFQREIGKLTGELNSQRQETEGTLQKLSFVEAKFQKLEAKKIAFFNEIGDVLELPKVDSKSYFIELDDAASAIRAELTELRASEKKNVEKKLIDEKLSLEAELAALQNELSKQHADAQKLRNEFEAHELENLDLQSQKINDLILERNTAHNEAEALRKKLSTLDTLSIEKQNFEIIISQLNEKISVKDTEIALLKTQAKNESEKLNELMDENARLCGDLLKRESETRQEFQMTLARERNAWASEKLALESRLASDNKELAGSHTDQGDSSLMKISTEPVPKPRIHNKNVLNTTDMIPNEDAQIKQLKVDLEKQKRLVTVLRKKLQTDLLKQEMQTLPRQ